MKRLFLIFSLWVLTLLPALAGDRYVYTQIAQPEGLTSTVNAICKEKDGEVWIGTPNGLYSFNGYNLKHYREQLLGSRVVYQIDVDSNGDLWVLTDKCVFRRPAGKDVFERISRGKDAFFATICDSNARWLGSMCGIYRYSYDDGTFKLVYDLPEEFECRSLCLLDDSTLLCCSHSGKILVDLQTGEISDADFGEIQQVYAALVDRKGRVWFALYNNGVQVYTY